MKNGKHGLWISKEVHMLQFSRRNYTYSHWLWNGKDRAGWSQGLCILPNLEPININSSPYAPSMIHH